MEYKFLKIRLPRHLYLEIKSEALKRNKSFAFIIRERIADSFKNPDTIEDYPRGILV